MQIEALENAEARDWEFTPEDGKNKGQVLSGRSLKFIARDESGEVCGLKVANPQKFKVAKVEAGQLFDLQCNLVQMKLEKFNGQNRACYSVDGSKDDNVFVLLK